MVAILAKVVVTQPNAIKATTTKEKTFIRVMGIGRGEIPPPVAQGYINDEEWMKMTTEQRDKILVEYRTKHKIESTTVSNPMSPITDDPSTKTSISTQHSAWQKCT